ncbi:MAG: Eco57I restriction-modification methylase domain-containing protein, partial [Leptospiraceae bacterium]|nr:Eco57I restriction-modification methylase domain-containing protein [Leptospiraceae bacterium]
SPNQNDIISAGVGFIDSNELWICNFNPNEFKKVIKNTDKITGKYFTLLEKAFEIPFDAKNLEPLFDRKDLIEEFYKLYRNTKEFLLEKNKVKGVPEERKGEFADQFLLTILTLWFLQERGFFNRDTNYLKNKFKEVNEKKGNFFEFLQKLFENLAGNTDEPIHHSTEFGDLVILGPALFLYEEKDIPLATISIENKCFYQEGMTERAISIEPKRLSDSLPILNLFESRDWAEGNIDEFVLGAVYEKLINTDEKKGTGSFYTPEDITTGMSEKAILDYIRKQFNKKFSKKSEYGLYAIIREASQEELVFLFELVSHLKICDPAVGSAHFLESAIETMVHVYEEIWKRAIILNLKQTFYIQTGNETGEIVKIDITDLHSEKESEKEKFYLYIKYFIILSRNIYGVDISQRALKVAKARLFLTMAKHFNLEKNTFVRFPNVHFNLREGNSLVGYITLAEPPANSKKRDIVSHDLFSFAAKDTNQLQKILEALPKDFKTKIQKLSQALGQKGKILQELEELGSILANKKLDSADFKRALEIKSDLSQIHIASLSTNFALKLQSILEKTNELFRVKLDSRFADEYELGSEGTSTLKRNKTFHWQMEFPEVFSPSSPALLPKGEGSLGFDIILGNPPYIQLQKIREQADLFEQLEYETFTKTGDIYCLFYERQIELLCSGGYGFFITSNSWMRTQYGAALRKYLLEHSNPLLLLNFEDTQIFDAAIVVPNMLLLEKEPYAKQLEAASVTSEYKVGTNLFTFFEKNKMHLKNLSDNEWSVGTKESSGIKGKMEKRGILVKDLKNEINFGIKTGLNEAFIINTETRNALVKADPKNDKIIKPMLAGRDLKKYFYQWDEKWLLFIPWHFPLHEDDSIEGSSSKAEKRFKEDFSSLYNHLSKYKKELSARNQSETGIRYEWYALQRCAASYLENFDKPKIIWGEIADSSKFALDEQRYFTNDRAWIMVGENLKYLVSIFNSKCIEWYFKTIATSSGMGTIMWKKHTVEQLPIPKSPIDNPELQKPLIELVEKILKSKDAGKSKDAINRVSTVDDNDTSHYEAEIDARVFHLYGLTEEEMLTVLNSFPKMRQEEKDLIGKFYREIK